MLLKYASVIRTFLIALFCVMGMFFANALHAQFVVISEYQNITAVPDGEYTELLVVADKIDLVGYTLRDNSGSGDWQGGVKFKDIPLWKNLRMGTVIVIGHRNVPGSVIGDQIATDGSIVVGALDANLFEKVLYSTTDWNANALSIAQTADMLQLLDPAGFPHYTLGHGNVSYRTAYFDPISNTTLKLFHEIAGITNNVYVYPGQSIADYNMPNPGNAKTRHSFFLSPSFANVPSIAPASTDLNQLFWRELRAPKWPFPAVTGTVSQASVNLSWNAAQDLYPADNYQGYLVMRGENSPNAIPQDGRTYAVGESIGGWEVVANIIGSGNTTFIDYKPIPCGDTTIYRIYAFRYTAPNINIDSIYCSTRPFVGKGRSYQEITFGTFSASRPAPAVPTITALGATETCDGSEVTLKVQTTYPSGTGYQWFKDGAPINGAIASEFRAKQAGTYRLKINAPSGCSNESNTITVTVLPKPTALLSPAKEIRLCTGDSVQLQAGPAGSTFTWLYNGAPIANTSTTFSAKQAGTYQVIVKDAKGCIDSSDVTTIVYRSITMSFPDPKIDFGNLDGCKSSVSADNLLRNTGKDTAIITKIDVPNGFQYVSPGLPIVLAPGKSVTLTFAFTPVQPGESKGDALIQTSSCNALASLNLRGFKEQASVTQSYSSADFGVALSCDAQPKDTTIIIENKGTTDLSITNPLFSSPYSVIAPTTFPLIVKANSSATLTVRYAPTGDGIFITSILLPYTAGTCKDTLRIAFSGEVRTPAFSISDSALTLSSMLGCVNSRDTSFSVTNTGKTDITLTPQSSPGIIILTPLPIQLKPGETTLVNVRIEPPIDGLFKDAISILATECGIKKVIVIETSKESASYTLSKTMHQFQSLIRCDAQSMLKDSIMIKASALGISGEATISNIDISGPFSASIVSGDKLTAGSRDFMITFAPTQDGVFTGKLTLTFEPCSIVNTIDLSGSLSSSTITVNQNSIVFPVTDSGMIEQREFSFTNTGKENIRLLSIGGFNAPFSYISSKNIGENIAPGETVTFNVSFAPNGNSIDSMLALLEIEGPCPQQIKVAISGIGNLPKPTDVNGLAELIGDSQSAKPGETVIFPIRISAHNIAEMNLGSMSFDIAYNRSLLLPKVLRMKQSQLTGMMTESSPGILSFTVNANDTISRVLEGNLLEFECMALLGDSMSTPLTIQNRTFVKRTPGICVLISNSPTFTLEDVCDLPNRLIRPNGKLSLAKINQSLSIEIFSQDRTMLDIHAMDGSLISRMVDGSLTSGVHEFALPNDLPSGMYVAILKSGHFTRTLPFGHVK
jgi:hypothetical protein